MKHLCDAEILFDDFAVIEKQLGEGYLNNSSVINSDCTNNIYSPQEDECISA
jgi:hypothetical protein